MEKIDNIKDIDTFYTQKVIPLAFNESLSYMEQICSLIDYIENTIVPTLNEHTDAINNLQAYVKMLKDLLDKLDKKVDDNFATLNTKIDTTKEELNTKIDTTKEELNTKIDTTKEELNTKIDTTKEELNTKIDTTKEELTNIINGINETLTNSINDLDTKVINHINESNKKFNNINTQIGSINNNIETINTNIGTINTQIESINTNVTQNTNDIMDLEIAKVKKISSYNSVNWRRASYYTNVQNNDSIFIYNKFFFLFVPLTNLTEFTTYIHFYDITEYPNLKNFVYLNIPDEIINIFGANNYVPDFPVNYIMVEKSNKYQKLTWEEAQTLPVYKAKLHIDTSANVSSRNHTLTFFDKTPEELSNKNIYVMNPVFGAKLQEEL